VTFFLLDLLLTRIVDKKYSKNPPTAIMNPYRDNAALSIYVPIPTQIAPRTRRNNPALTDPGIFILDINRTRLHLSIYKSMGIEIVGTMIVVSASSFLSS